MVSGRIPYATGSDAFGLVDTTAYGRGLLNTADRVDLQTLVHRPGDRKVSNYPSFDRPTNDFTVAQDHDGWLECDSADLTRLFNQDQYPDLFDVIGFSFSPGNTEPATGKFQLPYDDSYHPDARHFIFAGAPAY